MAVISVDKADGTGFAQLINGSQPGNLYLATVIGTSSRAAQAQCSNWLARERVYEEITKQRLTDYG